ncbi:MAG: glycosyltransferase family 1 protein [Pseudomonadota bacterium]
MTSNDIDILLDVSRTVSRLGAGGDSGVDRVERAYIRHLLAQDSPVHFLSRVLGGVALLDRQGMFALLDPASPDRTDILGHLARRQSPARRRAETRVRRLAKGWARHSRVPAFLREALPNGFIYLNTGHSNLDADHLRRIRAAGAVRIAVLVHDVIPLDYPEFSRPEAPARFERLLKGIAAQADLLIYNSADTARRTADWLSKWGVERPGVTALLGVDPLPSQSAEQRLEHPYFVVLGTIEPRKNHLLLLSIWRQFWEAQTPEQTPHLHIIGRRGWENEMVLDVLDRAPFMGHTVFEHGFVSDGELASRLANARALLFPSFAEGFGYPLAEALQMGRPVISADLPVYREIAPKGPTYLDPLDGPAWRSAIASASLRPLKPEKSTAGAVEMPDWLSHFEKVFQALRRGDE